MSGNRLEGGLEARSVRSWEDEKVRELDGMLDRIKRDEKERKRQRNKDIAWMTLGAHYLGLVPSGIGI